MAITQQNIVLAVAIAYHNREEKKTEFEKWAEQSQPEIARFILGVDAKMNEELFKPKHEASFSTSVDKVMNNSAFEALKKVVSNTFNSKINISYVNGKQSDKIKTKLKNIANGVAVAEEEDKDAEAQGGGKQAGGAITLTVEEYIKLLDGRTPVFPPFGSPNFAFVYNVLGQLNSNKTAPTALSSAAPFVAQDKAFVITLSGNKVVVADLQGNVQGDFDAKTCGNSGLNLKGQTCGKLLAECAGGRDFCIQSLLNIDQKEYMSDAELQKVNPIHVRDFLDKLDYPKVHTLQGNKEIIRFASFDEYLTKIKNTRAHHDLTNDGRVKNVRSLLERLAAYINTQYPNVLNVADLRFSSVDASTNRKAVSLKYPMSLANTRAGDMTAMMTPIIVGRTNSLVQSAYTPVGMVGFPMSMFGMKGGAGVGPEPESVTKLAAFYKDGIDNLLNALKEQGKALDPQSQSAINGRIANFQSATEEFAQYYQIVRDYVSTTARVRDQKLTVNVNDMKAHTDRYQVASQQYLKTELRVHEVLQKLQNLLSEAANKKNSNSWIE